MDVRTGLGKPGFLLAPLPPGGGDGDVQRVKDATDIVRLIGEQLTLRPKGREFAGICPFHNDSSPSMMVSPVKQIYKCFACGAGGDAFTFVIQYHKMEFREALEYLAQRAGVVLTPRTRRETPQHDEGTGVVDRASLLDAFAQSQRFFQAILAHPDHGASARAIIERRAISQEMVSAFGLGASPDRWDGLALTLQREGHPIEPLLAAGLLRARDSGGGHYDGFRNRLMFPICDAMGRIIAFGARRINDEDEPKYLNSPESRLFKKGATLYAMHLASRTIQTTRTALICEGYTDVIACHQAGFTNAVATLGTALTNEHAEVLGRVCDRVLLLFDGDQAGQRAADRATEVFFARPLDVAIVSFERHTDAKDPDELLKRPDGKAVFERAMKHATHVLEHRFERVRARLVGASDTVVARELGEEMRQLKDLGLDHVDPMRRALILKRIASLASVDEGVVRASYGALPVGRSPRRMADPSIAPDEASTLTTPNLHTAILHPNDHALACILGDGSLWNALSESDKDVLAPASFRWESLRRVAQFVHDVGEDGIAPSTDLVIARAREGLTGQDAEHVAACAINLMTRVQEICGNNPERLRDHFLECMDKLRKQVMLARALELKPAGASGDSQSVAQRLAAIAKVGADMRRLPRPSLSAPQHTPRTSASE